VIATDHDVIVVGAGPTGMLLAGELARRGAGVALWEARSDAAGGSRAIGIHPPVLAALDAPGLTAHLLENAVRVTRGIARSDGRRLGEVRFDRLPVRFPFVATVPQAHTEAVFAGAAPAVRRGATVRAVHDRGAYVEVEVEQDGARSSATARVVVLATGANGRALAPAALAVRSRPYRDRYLMADVDDAVGSHPHTAVITLDAAGVVESFPLPGGRRRLVARVGELADASTGYDGRGVDNGDPTTRSDASTGASDTERLSRAVAARTGEMALAAAVQTAGVSSFGIRRSLARRLRSGRILAIGDLVHEVSPIGGQGMNLGLLDAVTLAPLLTAWLAGPEPADELTRWERDRLVSARWAARLAGLNTAIGRPRTAAVQSLATTALAVALSPSISRVPARAYAMGLDRHARLA
jgi:2-polyprenyl-6-methoxyphenol hydroxylase-like FAD-dependent oxidoreductase